MDNSTKLICFVWDSEGIHRYRYIKEALIRSWFRRLFLLLLLFNFWLPSNCLWGLKCIESPTDSKMVFYAFYYALLEKTPIRILSVIWIISKYTHEIYMSCITYIHLRIIFFILFHFSFFMFVMFVVCIYWIINIWNNLWLNMCYIT